MLCGVVLIHCSLEFLALAWAQSQSYLDARTHMGPMTSYQMVEVNAHQWVRRRIQSSRFLHMNFSSVSKTWAKQLFGVHMQESDLLCNSPNGFCKCSRVKTKTSTYYSQTSTFTLCCHHAKCFCFNFIFQRVSLCFDWTCTNVDVRCHVALWQAKFSFYL